MKIGFPFDIIKAHKRKGVLRMYEIGEKVLYGIHGVCRISDPDGRVPAPSQGGAGAGRQKVPPLR